MKYKAMKFNIGDDPECSKRVQAMLFSLGYTWSYSSKTLSYTSKHYLYAGTDSSLGYGSDLDFFGRQNDEEINIDWLRTPEPITKRPTIKVGDKEYYEDELSEALSKIKAIR